MKTILSRPIVVYIAQALMLLMSIIWAFVLYQNVVYRLVPETRHGTDPSGGMLLFIALPSLLLALFLVGSIIAFIGLMLRKQFGRWIAIGILSFMTLSLANRAITGAFNGSSGYENVIQMAVGLSVELLFVVGIGLVAVLMAGSGNVKEFFTTANPSGEIGVNATR